MELVQHLKEKFLNNLKNSKGGYKRYAVSPIRYAGGKSLAVGYIVELIPDDIQRLVSPFFGGGNLELAVTRELNIAVQGYEIFDLLVNYWKIQIEMPLMLGACLNVMKPTKENYKKVKEMLKAHWEGEKLIYNNLILAQLYYFNHNLSYGPGFLGWISSVYSDPVKYGRMVEKVSKFKGGNLKVDAGDFKDTIPKHNKEFLYCDPPYYLGDDSSVFRGIYPQRNFPIHHKGFDHGLLCELLKKHKGGFILSYNDCEYIRELYKDFEIKKVNWQYTMGQGETRIGNNRKNKGEKAHIKKSNEILIVGKK